MSTRIAFPHRRAFISHAYDDSAEIATLRSALPEDFQPFLFERIEVEPHEAVSTPIIDAIKAAPALIFLDSTTSKQSFWVTFERELALASGIPVYRWDCARQCLQAISVVPPGPMIDAFYDESDEAVAVEILDWALNERGFSFETFSGIHSMSELDIALMEFDGLFIAFASKSTADEFAGELESIVEWKSTRGFRFPRLIVACLDDPSDGWIPDSWERFFFNRRSAIVDLTDGGRVLPYSKNRVDDLIVRAHWLHFQLRTTVGYKYHLDAQEMKEAIDKTPNPRLHRTATPPR